MANLTKAKELGFMMAQSGRFKQWRDLAFEQFNTLPWEKLPEAAVSEVKQKKEDISHSTSPQ